MSQGISLGDVLQVVQTLQAERTATGRKQYLLDGIVVFADQALEDGGMFTVNWQDGRMVLLGQLQNQLTGHHQRLLISQRDGLPGTDGMDSGRQSCEAHHGGEHDINRSSLHDVIEGLGTSIYLHIGQVGHQSFQLVVACLVGNDDGCRMEAVCLFCQQFHTVVSRQGIHFI